MYSQDLETINYALSPKVQLLRVQNKIRFTFQPPLERNIEKDCVIVTIIKTTFIFGYNSKKLSSVFTLMFSV